MAKLTVSDKYENAFITTILKQIEDEIYEKVRERLDKIAADVVSSVMVRVASNVNLRMMEKEIVFSCHLKDDRAPVA